MMNTMRIDTGDLAADMLRAAVDHAIAENTPLGHEAFAEVVLPQVPEGDRGHLEIGLFAAFQAGLFKGVAPEVLRELPADGFVQAVDTGRQLARVMEKVQASRNPGAVDFRLDEMRVIAAWLKLVEGRVPARNKLCVYAGMGATMSGGGRR